MQFETHELTRSETMQGEIAGERDSQLIRDSKMLIGWTDGLSLPIEHTHMGAARRLGIHVLSLVRPDDGEAVTEVWLTETFGPHLTSGPRKRYSLHFAMVRGMSVSWCPPCGSLPACICIESLAIIESPTRGDVRNLRIALKLKD